MVSMVYFLIMGNAGFISSTVFVLCWVYVEPAKTRQ